MESFASVSPVEIRLLDKTAGEAFVLEQLQGSARMLLVLVPRSLCTKLSLTAFFSALQGDGHCVHLVTDIPSNPTVDRLQALLAQLREKQFEPDGILAIGGGSCIDMAKGVSALWHLPLCDTASASAVRDAISGKKYAAEGHRFLPIWTMPTTAGTGSEVTHWATLWDTDQLQKLSIDCPALYPQAAVLVPEWTATMPDNLTLSTGLDALSHAMEAFWAKASNPQSKSLALAAIDRVRVFLPLVLASPMDVALRREMCLASLLAGLAFSTTRTTACHSISYPLTLLYALPHGYAAAVSLSAVMRRNGQVLPEIEQIQALFAANGGFDRWLTEVCEEVHPLRLSAFGIGEAALPSLAEMAFTTGRMDNNPIVFTKEECLAILRECL